MGDGLNPEAQTAMFERALEGDERKNYEKIGEKVIVEEMAEQANEAFKRSRSALIILFLASLVLFVGFFDHRGTWLYTKDYIATEQIDKDLKEPVNPAMYSAKFPNDALIAAINRESENNKPEYKRHLLHDVWDGNFKTLEVPALGIEFYVDDLPLVGAIAVFLILSWFYVFTKRGSGITKVIRDKVIEAHQKNESQIVEYLYNSLALNQIFVTVEDIDEMHPDPGKIGKDPFKNKIVVILSCLLLFASIIAVTLFHGEKDFYLASIAVIFAVLFSFIFWPGAAIYLVNVFAAIKDQLVERINVALHNSFNLNAFGFAQLFFRFGLLFPIIVLTTVLGHDIYETYFWDSRGIYLPNSKLKREARVHLREVNMKELPDLPKDSRKLEYDDYSITNQYYIQTYLEPLEDSLKDRLAKIDSPIDSNRAANWKAKKHVLRQFEHEKDSTHEIFFEPATLFADLEERELYYKQMNTKMFRIGGFMTNYSLKQEVIVLRTILPSVVIFVCFLITMAILKLHDDIQECFNVIKKFKDLMFKKQNI